VVPGRQPDVILARLEATTCASCTTGWGEAAGAELGDPVGTRSFTVRHELLQDRQVAIRSDEERKYWGRYLATG
jgi:hypothetical protein